MALNGCETPIRQISGPSAAASPAGFAIWETRLMRKLLVSFVFMALTGTLALAVPQRDRDDRRDKDDRHDNGKHKGRDKHDDEDRGDHDNGKHKGWDNPHN